MATKKYVSLHKLSIFLDNLRNTFAALSHKHTMSDISDYIVDDALSSTSTNPVQNKILDAEFDVIANSFAALEMAIDGKMDNMPIYEGAYEVIPSTTNDITLLTAGTVMDSDIKINKIPYVESENASGGTTITIG